MATNTPSVAISCVSPETRSRRRTPVTDFIGFTVPSTSATSAFQTTLTFLLGEEPVLQDTLGSEAFAAVDHRDGARDVGEVERLLDGRVATADHDHVLAAIEEPSHVAQAETPKPWKAASDSSPSQRAWAPVA